MSVMICWILGSIENVLFVNSVKLNWNKMREKVRILVGYDFSLQSKKALTEAISIAKNFSGYIKVVNVYGKGMKEKAEVSIIEVKEVLNQEKVAYEVELILGSDPAKVLETTAKKENFDIVVIGSRGLGNKISILLGSVSRDVVTNAQCNVLVVKK